MVSVYMNLHWQSADIDALYSVHRSHECERRALERKEREEADKKQKQKQKGKMPEHRGKKTKSGNRAARKRDGESASATEPPSSDTYPGGFGIQLAHVTLLRKVLKQNQAILRQLEAQGVILSAIVREEVQTPPPLNVSNEEMVKSAKLSCQVLEKLLEKFEVKAHGLDLPVQVRTIAMGQ